MNIVTLEELEIWPTFKPNVLARIILMNDDKRRTDYYLDNLMFEMGGLQNAIKYKIAVYRERDFRQDPIPS